MHNVYRVHSSNSVDLSTVQLTISLGEQTAGRTFANTSTGPVPYIKLFGLDEDAPELFAYLPPNGKRGACGGKPCLRPIATPAWDDFRRRRHVREGGRALLGRDGKCDELAFLDEGQRYDESR